MMYSKRFYPTLLRMWIFLPVLQIAPVQVSLPKPTWEKSHREVQVMKQTVMQTTILNAFCKL